MALRDTLHARQLPTTSPGWSSCLAEKHPLLLPVHRSRSRRSDLLYSCDPELTVASSSSWTPSTSEILLGGVLDHLRDGGVATFRIGACAAQIRRIHGEILASNFHRGSSKLPISAMTFLAVVERGLSCSLAVGAKSSSARGGAVAAHILVPWPTEQDTDWLNAHPGQYSERPPAGARGALKPGDDVKQKRGTGRLQKNGDVFAAQPRIDWPRRP